MSYLSLTQEEKKKMFETIGVSSFEDLLACVPASLRNASVDIPLGVSELEIQRMFQEYASQNETTSSALSFLGAGSYEHFIPSAVSQLVSRSEFYTAYTPYQPEASQGTLQAIYEYQSMMTELTGLDVSNASHYDGSTALAEAVLLTLRHTDRKKILLSRSLHPHYRQVIHTYLLGTPYSVVEIGLNQEGLLDREQFEGALDEEVAGAVFQTPNFFGAIEDLEGISEKLHEIGALMILSSHPLAFPVLKSPGEWGADIAAGEGQPLGIGLQYGGPYLGYFATTRALMRRIPGRIAGISKDEKGRRCFCLTLQAREQHIRRERASSNICTNQALCALAACVYMTLLGKEGMKEVAELNMDRAYYLRDEISKLKGFEVEADLPIFNEFRVKSEKPFSKIQEKLLKKNIFAGVDLSQFYPELKNQFLVCATETKTREAIDHFVKELSQC